MERATTGLLVLAVLAAVLLAAPGQSEAVVVKCMGTAGGGSGIPASLPGGVTWPAPQPLDYLYEVILMPGDHWHAFQVGTDDGILADYSGISHSSNWFALGGSMGTLMLSPNVYESHNVSQDTGQPIFTPHGTVSAGGPNGNCPYSVLWVLPPFSDDSSGGTFYFGFDNPNAPHDVGATVYTSLLGYTWDEDWSKPVGGGDGPVHGPLPEPSTLALLGIGALGLLVYARRRRR